MISLSKFLHKLHDTYSPKRSLTDCVSIIIFVHKFGLSKHNISVVSKVNKSRRNNPEKTYLYDMVHFFLIVYNIYIYLQVFYALKMNITIAICVNEVIFDCTKTFKKLFKLNLFDQSVKSGEGGLYCCVSPTCGLSFSCNSNYSNQLKRINEKKVAVSGTKTPFPIHPHPGDDGKPFFTHES